MNNRKRILPVVFFVLLLLAIPLTILLVRQEQDIRQRASGPSTPIQEISDLPNRALAIVAGRTIFTNDVKKETEKQYEIEAIDRNVLNIILEGMIEKEILKHALQSENIVIDESLVAKEIERVGGETEDEDEKERARLELVKRYILENHVDSWSAYVIGYWMPSSPETDQTLTEEEIGLLITQKSDGPRVIGEAALRLGSDSPDLPRIALDLIGRYPSIKDVLGINGFIWDQSDDNYLLTVPKIYTQRELLQNQDFLDSLSDMQIGEVKIIESEDSNSGSAVKLVNRNPSDIKTYEQWYEIKKRELLTLYEPL